MASEKTYMYYIPDILINSPLQRKNHKQTQAIFYVFKKLKRVFFFTTTQVH